MSEEAFQAYKAELFEALNARERDREGFVWAEAAGDEGVDRLGRALRELKKDGRFREIRSHNFPLKWAVKI